MTSTRHELSLVSTSRASDGAYLALVDAANMASRLNVEYRIVGGNAVTLLSGIHAVEHLVPPRETADVDFGASYQVVADARLPAVLASMGYERAAGNRFVRAVPDSSGELTLAIDVLAPSYENHLVVNRKHGEHPRDALDIWRLMEAAHAAGITREQWPSGPTTNRAAAILRQHFASPAGSGARSATTSGAQLRIRALAVQLLPAG